MKIRNLLLLLIISIITQNTNCKANRAKNAKKSLRPKETVIKSNIKTSPLTISTIIDFFTTKNDHHQLEGEHNDLDASIISLKEFDNELGIESIINETKQSSVNIQFDSSLFESKLSHFKLKPNQKSKIIESAIIKEENVFEKLFDASTSKSLNEKLQILNTKSKFKFDIDEQFIKEADENQSFKELVSLEYPAEVNTKCLVDKIKSTIKMYTISIQNNTYVYSMSVNKTVNEQLFKNFIKDIKSLLKCNNLNVLEKTALVVNFYLVFYERMGFYIFCRTHINEVKDDYCRLTTNTL